MAGPFRWSPYLGAIALAMVSAAGAETSAGDRVLLGEAVADDLYAAGRVVVVDGAVDGDAILAGATVSLGGDVSGDVVVAGGRVVIDGGVGDDLRVFAGNLSVRGFITDQAVIAAGTVDLRSGSAIGGRAWISAGDATIDGDIGGDLGITAGTVTVGGKIAGTLEIDARDITIASGAVVLGDLVWRGTRPPDISAGAHIAGEVIAGGGSRATARSTGEPRRVVRWPAVAILFVTAAVLAWLLPGLVRRAAALLRAAPGRTVITGSAVLVLAPVLAVMLVVTGLGILLGLLVVMGVAFAALLALPIVARFLHDVAGMPTGSSAGSPAAVRPGWRELLLLLFVTVAVVWLQSVPLLGWALTLLLLLIGLGATARSLTNRSKPPGP